MHKSISISAAPVCIEYECPLIHTYNHKKPLDVHNFTKDKVVFFFQIVGFGCSYLDEIFYQCYESNFLVHTRMEDEQMRIRKRHLLRKMHTRKRHPRIYAFILSTSKISEKLHTYTSPKLLLITIHTACEQKVIQH